MIKRPILIEDEIPKPIKHLHPINLLDGLDNMRVVADHQVRPGINSQAGQVTLGPIGLRDFFRTPMRQNDHHIGNLLG